MPMTRHTRVGTLAWADRTQGKLARRERFSLLMDAALARLNRRLSRFGGAPLVVDLSTIKIPDSALCIEAQELLESVSEPWLVNHCLRTYAWAKIVGLKEQLVHDDEQLFLASALHDLGLCSAGARLAPQPADCFAVEGAWAAQSWLASKNAPASLATNVAEAIALHLNVHVPASDGAEAHLLHEGAMIDVVGIRLEEISPLTKAEVLARHPRLDLKKGLCNCLKHDARRRPQSRAGFLVRNGFIGLIRSAPYTS